MQGDSPVPHTLEPQTSEVQEKVTEPDKTSDYTSESSKKKSSAESDYGKDGKEHTSNKSPIKENKHEEGRSRHNRDRGGEKGDVRRTRYK